MKFLDLWRMSSQSLWKRKVRTLLTMLGVVIGTASIVIMLSIGLGLDRAAMKQIEENGGLTTVNVYGSDNRWDMESSSGTDGFLDDKLVEEIKKLDHVQMASPVLSVYVIAKYGVYEGQFNVQGMSLESLATMNIPFASGGLPSPDDTQLKFIYGDKILMDFQNAKTYEGYWDTGVMPDIDLMNDSIFVIFDTDAYWSAKNPDPDNPVKPPKKYLVEASGQIAGEPEVYSQYSWSVYCNIDALKTQLKKIFKNKVIPGQPSTSAGKPYKDLYYNNIQVTVDNMENVKEVQQAIVDLGYQAESNMEWIESTRAQYKYIQAALGGIGAISLIVAAIGITNTMMMSIYERTKEIGIMKVLGCDMKNIQTMFLIEAGFIGFIGGVAGLLFSCGVSAIINVFSRSLADKMELSYIPFWLAITSIIFAVIVGMIAGFFPSLRAMKLSPLAAIRNE